MGDNRVAIQKDDVYTLCQFQLDGGTTGLRIGDPMGNLQTSYLEGRCTVFDGNTHCADLKPNVIYQFRGEDLASCMSPSGPHAEWWGSRRSATYNSQAPGDARAEMTVSLIKHPDSGHLADLRQLHPRSAFEAGGRIIPVELGTTYSISSVASGLVTKLRMLPPQTTAETEEAWVESILP